MGHMSDNNERRVNIDMAHGGIGSRGPAKQGGQLGHRDRHPCQLRIGGPKPQP